MRRAETLFALLLVVGAGVGVREALRLPVGWTAAGPGSGFFPLLLTLGVAFNAILILGRSVRTADPQASGPFIPRTAFGPLLVVFLPMLAVIALIDYLGIYLGGAVYLAGYTRLVGRFRWITVILVGVLIPLVLFLIFEKWFLLPMPKGAILEFLLYGR
jgi:hypothetical protein